MVLYPNKLPESERVCSGICTTLKALSLATALIYLHDCMNLSAETCLVSGYEASQPVSFRFIRHVVSASHSRNVSIRRNAPFTL